MKVYIISSIVLFLLALIFNTSELYYLIIINLGIALIFKYISKETFKKLSFERTISQNRIFKGEKAEIKLKFKNNSIWPIFCFDFIEQVPIKLRTPLSNYVISLAPQEEWKETYTLKGKERGLYNVGLLSGSLGDSLGITKEKIEINTKQEIIVYPKVFPLDDLGLPSRIAFGDLIWPQRIYRDSSSFRGLREYQKGDRIKDVYWPTTASFNQLMVKEYESTITVENLIFLNLKKEDYGIKRLHLQIELAIEVAASISNYLIDAKQSVGLVTNGQDKVKEQEIVKVGQGAGHLMKIMELLARIEMTEDKTYLNLIEKYRHKAAPGSTLLLITKVDTQRLVNEAIELCRSGLNVVIIVLGAEVVHDRYLNRSYTENLVIYQVNRKEDIYAWGN